MRQHTSDIGEVPIGLGEEISGVIRRAVGTRSRRWLLAITLLLGLTAAAAVAAGLPSAERTLATLAQAVQLLLSVMVPFSGVLLAHDLRRAPRTARIAPTLLGAVLLAAVIGAFGFLACAAALALASSTAPAAWDHAVAVAAGGVLVQVLAQLVGTGLGLLLRRPVIACLATIALPLGLWYALGRVDALSPAQAWLTPFASAQNLLSGQMSAVMWAQWLVVLTLWGRALNAAGLARLSPRTPAPNPWTTES
ncbi:hypothetical protein Pta02_23970 [Planobispora takensis]|uniref:Uncharacterized protein n=2 Tax=Planobispora takensis TaxID=1367882 RepID=A0A8J3STK3_9ACTN|nr:hypothetical protein Pta02_23970 [Planobispora takensis]